MTTTTAKLAAAKLDETLGIPDQTADAMFAGRLGATHMAIVELQVAERTEGKADKHTVKLQAIHLELAGDTAIADHLRDLSRAIYTGRTPKQLDIDSFDDVEPDAEEILRRGQGLLPCPNCLHAHDLDRIDHLPDTETDGWCSWRPCGHPVNAGDTTCTHPDHNDSGPQPAQDEEHMISA